MDFTFGWSILKDVINGFLKVRKWFKEKNLYQEQIRYFKMRDFPNSKYIVVIEKNWSDLCWPNIDKIELKKEGGWEIIDEIDKKNKIRYTFRIRENPDLILMGKKK